MARNRGKKALYEVVGHSDYGGKLQPLYPAKTDKPQDLPTTSTPADGSAVKPYRWPKGPKIIQFNAGRVELSLPYQLAIALVLGLVLLILVVFRLGQSSIARQNAGTEIDTKAVEITSKKTQPTVAKLEPLVAKREVAKMSVPAETAQPTGNNRIVIQTCNRRSDLEPVKKFFAENGIETEIRRIDSIYYLLSRQKYQNPNRSGTDGYSARKKIIELGAKYKAPPGCRNFGSRPFHDAYGMRFND